MTREKTPRKTNLSEEFTSMRINTSLTALIAALPDPQQQLEKLTKEIKSLIKDPSTDPSIPRRIAEAILLTCTIEQNDFAKIVAKVNSIDAKGEIRTSRGALFVSELRKLGILGKARSR